MPESQSGMFSAGGGHGGQQHVGQLAARCKRVVAVLEHGAHRLAGGSAPIGCCCTAAFVALGQMGHDGMRSASQP